MVGSTSDQEIIATTKFKSSKPLTAAQRRQQQSEVVDDWDADSDGEGETQVKSDSKDVFQATKDQWTVANSQAPAPVPVVASGHGRSLPEAAFGHRLGGSSTPTLQRHDAVTIAAAPPRILQRPKEAGPGMRSDGTSANASNSANQERKTVEQRQEEYRLARERIFGASSNASSGKSKSSKR